MSRVLILHIFGLAKSISQQLELCSHWNSICMWINIHECTKYKGLYITTRGLGGQSGYSHWNERRVRYWEFKAFVKKCWVIKPQLRSTANRKLQLLLVGVTAHRCMEMSLFRFVYSRTKANVIKNVSPWQNQGCTFWPWNQTATCTACLHHTTVQEAFQGTCTGRFASAHPPDRKPGWSWWTQQTIHISDVATQAQLSDQLKALVPLNAAVGPTQGSGWDTGGCRWTRRRRHCFQPELET